MSWWVFKNNYFYFRILSDLQEHLRDSTESSHKSCTHFPVINIFHYCGQARQLKNQYWHIIVNESPFYTQSSLVLTQGPFSVPGSHPKYLIAFSSHVPLGLTASVSQNFLWFWWLHQSAECWAAILWNIPWLGRVWCFLLRRAGSWVWGKEEHIDIILIISWQGCTVSAWPVAVDVHLDYLGKCFSSVSTVQLTLSFPLSTLFPLGGGCSVQPTPKGQGIMFHPFEGELSAWITCNPLKQDIFFISFGK